MMMMDDDDNDDDDDDDDDVHMPLVPPRPSVCAVKNDGSGTGSQVSS